MAVTYPYACFACRSAFKRWVSWKFDERPLTLTCPRCGHKAVCLSRKFKPPRRSDTKQWEKVRALVIGGCFFHSYADPYPDTLKEVPAFLRKRRAYLEQQMRLYPHYFDTIIEAAKCP